MTIKQIGGIFGRNPTFSDVSIEGNVNADGKATFAGPVCIGTDTSSALLEVSGDIGLLPGTGASAIRMNNASSGNHAAISAGIPGVSNAGMDFVVDGNRSMVIKGGNFYVGIGTSSVPERLTVAGNISLTGNVIVPSGKGIDFSATSGTGTSELFDDYEEGTWTPNFSSFVGFTVTDEVYTGRYIKCGRVVTVEIEGQFTSSDTVAVDDRFWTSGVSGELPFAPEGTGSVLGAGAGFMFNGLSAGSNAFFHVAVAPAGEIYVYVTHVDGTIGWDAPFAITLTYISGA